MVPPPRIINIGSLEELFSDVAAEVPVLASPRGSCSPRPRMWTTPEGKDSHGDAPSRHTASACEADAVQEHMNAMMGLTAVRQKKEAALQAAADAGGDLTSTSTSASSSSSGACRDAGGDSLSQPESEEDPAAGGVQEKIRRAAQAARARRQQEAEDLRSAGDKILQAAHEAWERREAATRQAEDQEQHQQLHMMRQQEQMQMHLQHQQQLLQEQKLQQPQAKQQRRRQQRQDGMLMPMQGGVDFGEQIDGGACWIWEAPMATHQMLMEQSPLATHIWMAASVPAQAWARLGYTNAPAGDASCRGSGLPCGVIAFPDNAAFGRRLVSDASMKAMPSHPQGLQQQGPHALWFGGSDAKVGCDEPYGPHSQWGGC